METSSTGKISIQAAERWVPANFFRRLVALILDTIIVGIAAFPISFGLTMYALAAAPNSIFFNHVLPTAVRFVLMYFYFGYFYSNKGATPGKMVMNLRVINSETGKNLSYWRAFFRETVGRICSTLPLFIGYLMIPFREDRKGLHDLLFNTQVLHQTDAQ